MARPSPQGAQCQSTLSSVRNSQEIWPHFSRVFIRSTGSLNFPAQPGSGKGPQATGRSLRNAENLRCLGEFQSGEIAQLYEVCRLAMSRDELVQGYVKG